MSGVVARGSSDVGKKRKGAKEHPAPWSDGFKPKGKPGWWHEPKAKGKPGRAAPRRGGFR